MVGPRCRALLVACLALPAAGCVTASWNMHRREREVPVEEAVADGLVPGAAALDDALAHFGAPLLVREHGDGALCAWGWSHERSWSVTVRTPGSRRVSPSFRYADALVGLEGVALFFDAEWRLVALRRGALAEIVPASAQRRAQAPADDDGPSGGLGE